MVVVALVGGGSPLEDGADATVEIRLVEGANVDAVRQQVIQSATGAWQARRISETSGDSDEAAVEFALPSSNLDGIIGELRRLDSAESARVNVDLDPEQAGVPTRTDGSATPAEPVTLAVTLRGSSGGGPWVTIIGAVVVALLALGAIGLVSRRFGADSGFDSPDPRR